MVLIEQWARDDTSSRGQVLLLMTVIIGLLLIASAITLNYGLAANLDRSEGVTTQSVSSDLAYSVESNTRSTIVASNRGDLDFDNAVQDQFDAISRDQRFSRVDLSLTVTDTVDGIRLTNDGNELTGDGATDWTVFSAGSSELISGGITIDSTDNTLPATSDPESGDALMIETQNHEIYIYRPADDPSVIEALFIGDSQSTHRSTSGGNPHLDLGEGSFDGKLFAGYDQADTRSVEIQNGHRANGTIEFVTTGTTSTHSSLVEENAIFGAGIDIQLNSNNEATEQRIFVTHGPTRRGL